VSVASKARRMSRGSASHSDATSYDTRHCVLCWVYGDSDDDVSAFCHIVCSSYSCVFEAVWAFCFWLCTTGYWMSPSFHLSVCCIVLKLQRCWEGLIQLSGYVHGREPRLQCAFKRSMHLTVAVHIPNGHCVWREPSSISFSASSVTDRHTGQLLSLNDAEPGICNDVLNLQ